MALSESNCQIDPHQDSDDTDHSLTISNRRRSSCIIKQVWLDIQNPAISYENAF